MRTDMACCGYATASALRCQMSCMFGRLLTLRALIHVKADLLVFLQRFAAFCLNLEEVREQLLATIIRRHEHKTLRIAAKRQTLTVVRARFQSAVERS